MAVDVGMRGLRGFHGLRGLHPIFLSHHLPVLLVVIVVFAIYMAVRQSRR